MKTIVKSFIIIVVLSLTFYENAHGQAFLSTPACTNCQGTAVNPARVASTIGISTTANDSAAFASGKYSQATGMYATALGFKSYATGRAAFAAGFYAKANNDFAVAIGKFVQTGAKNAIVIGNGYLPSGQYLVNNKRNSIMLGVGGTVPAIYIDSASSQNTFGYVGIGTTTPTVPLEVNGTIKTTGLQLTTGAVDGRILKSNGNGAGSWVDPKTVTHWEVDGNIMITQKMVGSHHDPFDPFFGSFMIGNEFVFYGNGTGVNKIIGSNYKYVGEATRINDGYASTITLGSNGSITLNAAGTGLANSTITWKSMVFTPEGKLGVGISSPAYTLDVQGVTQVDAHIHSQSNSNSTIWSSNTQNSYGFGVGIDGKGHLYRNIGMDNLMTFTQGGKVLIGDEPTELPGDYKLYVKGKIITTEVKIATAPWSWPDYVLKDDYNLMSLHELETFITSNHHLPDVPCEDEVKENGMNLGENDALLLKKIEELTLYILQQEKKITVLQQKVETLQSNK